MLYETRSTIRCPNGHTLSDIGVRCPQCPRLIIFKPETYAPKALIQGSLLVLSTVTVLMLSRVGSQVWPLYMYLTLGVVLLYAAIYSRGETLRQATWILSLTALLWLAWEVASSQLNLTVNLGPTADLVLRLLPVPVWVALTAYMYDLAKHSEDPVRISARYFLTTATLTFGFWGVWMVLLENGSVTPAMYRVAVVAGALLPLIGIVVFYLEMQTGSGFLDLLSLWFVVAAAYLILVEPMILALTYVLGRFFPMALGEEPLADINIRFAGADWRAVVISILLLVAVTLIAVHSAVEVGRESTFTHSLKQATTDLTLPQLIEEGTAPELRGFWRAGDLGSYIGRTGLKFIANIIRTMGRVVNVVMPVALFSSLSILLALVLSELRGYRDHGPFFTATSLWGVGLTTLIGMVVACSLASELGLSGPRAKPEPMLTADRTPDLSYLASRETTDLAGHTDGEVMVVAVEDAVSPLARSRTVWLMERPPARRVPPTDKTKDEKHKWWITRLTERAAAASLLGGLLYFLVCLVSLALLPLWLYLSSRGVTVQDVAPGEIYYTNLYISMTALVLLVAVLAFYRWLSNRKSAQWRIYRHSLTAGVIIVLASGAFYLSLPPIQVAATYAAGSHDTTAATSLRESVPAEVIGTCHDDRMMLVGYSAGLTCRLSTGQAEVSYHLFATAERLNHWYLEAMQGRHITGDQGDCLTTTRAEGDYSHIGSHGRFLCYTDRAGSWLMWTDVDTRTLCLVRSATLSVPEIYSLWESGTFTRTV